MSWSSNDWGENGSGCVVSGETGLAHAGPVVHHQSSWVVVAHVEQVWSPTLCNVKRKRFSTFYVKRKRFLSWRQTNIEWIEASWDALPFILTNMRGGGGIVTITSAGWHLKQVTAFATLHFLSVIWNANL
jgi:hypothetical protein